jgi:hypothetical protein
MLTYKRQNTHLQTVTMYTQLTTFLNSAIRADPLLYLANAVCWLDPLWRSA